MGEMCLAEEMFEEAKQVFERLTKADPGRPYFWEQLNRARGRAGPVPMMPPSAQPRPSIPCPSIWSPRRRRRPALFQAGSPMPVPTAPIPAGLRARACDARSA